MPIPLLVFVGGGLGAVLRYAVTLYVQPPGGTLIVNIFGSLIISFLLHPSVGITPEHRALLVTGFLGGLTTYSSFDHELVEALVHGRWSFAAFYAGLTGGSCLAGGAAGWFLAGHRPGGT